MSRLRTSPLKNAGERHQVMNMRMTPSSSAPIEMTKMPPVCQPNSVICVSLFSGVRVVLDGLDERGQQDESAEQRQDDADHRVPSEPAPRSLRKYQAEAKPVSP